MISNYEILKNGVIKQIEIINEIQTYDKNYVDVRYNTYGEKSHQMAGLRLGYLLSKINFLPKSILDIGYGNGDFLRMCSQKIDNCYGNDISNYPVPENCNFIDDIFSRYFDIICFFDALEHFEEIDFVKNLNCEYIYISLPWCHYFSDDWFFNWKHRREDEHLWHFNDKSLVNFMDEMGFEVIDISNIEDIIRKSNSENQNILTGIFRKKNIKSNDNRRCNYY
jgi:hypothetical protein